MRLSVPGASNESPFPPQLQSQVLPDTSLLHPPTYLAHMLNNASQYRRRRLPKSRNVSLSILDPLQVSHRLFQVEKETRREEKKPTAL